MPGKSLFPEEKRKAGLSKIYDNIKFTAGCIIIPPPELRTEGRLNQFFPHTYTADPEMNGVLEQGKALLSQAQIFPNRR